MVPGDPSIQENVSNIRHYFELSQGKEMSTFLWGLHSHFNVQENTKDEAAKNECGVYFAQVIINSRGVKNPKPERITRKMIS